MSSEKTERNFRFIVEVKMFTTEKGSDTLLADTILECGLDSMSDVSANIVEVLSLPPLDVRRQRHIADIKDIIGQMSELDDGEESKWVLVKKTEDGNEYEF